LASGWIFKINVFVYTKQNFKILSAILDGYINELIQVCSDLSDPQTKERERNGLLAGMKHFKIQEGTIVTADTFGEEKIEGRRVRYVPLWRLLLE